MEVTENGSFSTSRSMIGFYTYLLIHCLVKTMSRKGKAPLQLALEYEIEPCKFVSIFHNAHFIILVKLTLNILLYVL